MDKSEELFGLHKVSDDALIKQLLLERGKNLSYIEELEEELGQSGGCAKYRVKEEPETDRKGGAGGRNFQSTLLCFTQEI